MTDFAPFGEAPFYTGDVVTSNYVLSDDAYRTLILIKAAANIASTTSQTINALLRSIFTSRGRAYVCDLGSMQMQFVFEFYLVPFEMAILTQSGALPRPAAVETFLLQVPAGSTFGFQEAGGSAQPFGQGSFLAQENYIHVG